MQKVCSLPCAFCSLNTHGLILALRELPMPDTRPKWVQVYAMSQKRLEQGHEGWSCLMKCRGLMARGLMATSWSSSLKRDSLMTAEREAPMPPVFMHSSTMMHLRVFLMLFVMVSKSNGFRLIRSITCTARAFRNNHYMWPICNPYSSSKRLQADQSDDPTDETSQIHCSHTKILDTSQV